MRPVPRTELGTSLRRRIDECERQADESFVILRNARTTIEQTRALLRAVREQMERSGRAGTRP
jgi:hypothetical protein